MKKFYSLFLILVLAMFGLVANAKTFAVTGAAFGGWNMPPSSTQTFADNGDGTYTLNVSNATAGEFKLSGIDGSFNNNWDTFNGGAMGKSSLVEGDNALTTSFGTGNMRFPFNGDVTLTISNVTNSSCNLNIKLNKEVVVETEYFLVGGFNNWTQKDANYKFNKSGDAYTLTTTMSGEFKVMDQNGNWYGGGKTFTAEDNSITLSSGDNLKLNAESEYTFTIENGVLTVSGFPTEPATLTGVSLRGALDSSWSETFTWDMTLENGVYTLANKEISGYHEFKVVATYSDNTQKWLSPASDGNFLVSAEQLNNPLTLGENNPNLYFNAEADGTFSFAVAADLSTLTITGEFTPEPVEPAYYLIGGFNSWTEKDENYKFANNNGVFTLTKTVSGEFKVLDQDGKYYAAGTDAVTVTADNNTFNLYEGGMGNNMTLAAELEYTFTIENGVLTVTGFPVDELQNIVIMGGAAGATEWAQLTALTLNSETGKYETAAVEVAEGYEFKVVENWSVSGDHWKGAESNGAFLVDADQINKELSIEPQSEGENFKFAKAGTFSFVYDKENSKLWINGEFDPDAITLAEALAGEIGTTVVVGDNVAIADYNLIMGNDGMYNFITDGQGNYARLFVKTEDIMTAPVYGISAGFKAKKIADGVLEFVSGEDNESMEYEVVKFALTNDNFEPVANQVFQLIGYFQLENGVPKVSAFPGTNDKGISTSYVLNTDYAIDFDTDDFVVGKKYNFFGVLNPTTAPAGSKLKGHVDPSANSILLLDGTASPATAIDTINAAVDAKSIRYYNLQGVESATPFDGLNIVVVKHADGTTTTSKVIK